MRTAKQLDCFILFILGIFGEVSTWRTAGFLRDIKSFHIFFVCKPTKSSFALDPRVFASLPSLSRFFVYFGTLGYPQCLYKITTEFPASPRDIASQWRASSMTQKRLAKMQSNFPLLPFGRRRRIEPIGQLNRRLCSTLLFVEWIG